MLDQRAEDTDPKRLALGSFRMPLDTHVERPGRISHTLDDRIGRFGDDHETARMRDSLPVLARGFSARSCEGPMLAPNMNLVIATPVIASRCVGVGQVLVE